MNVEQAIGRLAATGYGLPRAAMQWSLEHWEDASPRFIEMLERYADGTDQSKGSADALFLILHLAGEKRDTRIFAPLCRLARDGEAIYDVLGDGVTETLARIMIGTFDGGFDALKGVIEEEDADESARYAALRVLAYLTAVGRCPVEETKAYLIRLYECMQPQDTNFAWDGWVSAIELLGLEDLSGLVEKAFERELIDPMNRKIGSFHGSLRKTLDDPDPMASFHRANVRPLDDAIGELSGWYGFSEQRRTDDQKRLARLTQPNVRLAQKPHREPLRAVGRNDPCPCGSGRKYKKCCLK
ncbi:MAG TPA: DUF1186 domain-containing protein [Arenibaculum sp.]|nr:DUF1186 domain-containing protein [Arenibaculum sp.]